MQSQVHLKARNHRCNHCDSRFARRDTLRRHTEGGCPKRFESAIDGFKLAAETHDSDDDLIQRSPPLVPRIVNLKPSPSPKRSPTPKRLSTSSNLKFEGKKRHSKAQVLQGDAILIGFLGGLNHPDLATKAGEELLSQSDDSDVDDLIDVNERERTDENQSVNDKNTELVHLAENALPLIG